MIDVNKFMAIHNLDEKETAKALFPKNAYPKMAFKRILHEGAPLTIEQVSKLAALAGVSIMQVFSGNWETKATPAKFIMENGDYRAELDWTGWITRLFHKDSMFHEEILTKPTIPLSEYVHEIGLRIAKHEFSL